ncbi:MAG: hypothetical protein BMS9Abin28_0899 [Anaerolineae bacterium]|nr:MAG: hypothetical protein BMS9Abin28_0899 [Anaerolineae bacterium]
MVLALSGLACNFAYGLIEDTTGFSLGGEEPSASPPPTLDEGPPSDDETPIDPGGEAAPADPITSPNESIPSEVREQMDQIQDEVVLLRGLRPSAPVNRALLSADELREYVLDDFLIDYSQEEAQDDARVLALLGLLDADYELFDLYLDLYSENIAGFYDDEIEQMFVVQDSRFGGPERLTYAHEYAHALQDQTYDLDQGLGFNHEACEEDSERCAALQALLEGDATLLEERWLLTYASDADFQQLLDFYDSFSSPAYESAPEFLKEDFLFPYTTGFDFVESVFLDGGWAAVDALYAAPPVSTEQILHPGRYPNDMPVPLTVPEVLDSFGSGWREMDRDVLGEWFTFLTLRERLPEEQAQVAAEGWGGDYYIAFHNDFKGQGVLVVATAWDTVRDAHEFYGAFRDYGDSRFGDRSLSSTTRSVWDSPDDWNSIDIGGDQTLWILAPDAEIGEMIREALTFPAELAE